MSNPFRPAPVNNVSFLPEDYVAKRAETRANCLILLLFGVVMFCVISAFFVTNRQWLTVRQQQHSINIEYTAEAKKIDQLKGLEEQKAEMMDKAEITTALLERVPRSVLLAELVTRMPEGITLLELNVESKRLDPVEEIDTGGKRKAGSVKTLSKSKGASAAKTKSVKAKAGEKKEPEEQAGPLKVRPPKYESKMTLVGVAAVNNDVTDYLSSLQACPLLEKVELSFIKTMKLEETELRQFEVVAMIRQDADARSVAPIEDLEAAREARQARSPIEGGDGEPKNALSKMLEAFRGEEK